MQSKRQSVFITGATGLTGFGAAQALVRRGHQVLGLSRSEEGARKLTSVGVEPLMGDLKDADILRQGAERAQSIIHAGFANDEAQKGNRGYADSLEQENIRTFIAAIEGKGKKLIYTSGRRVYGPQPVDVREDTPLQTPEKLVWRAELEQEVCRSGGVVLRPNLIYGPGDRLAIPVMIRAALALGVSYCPGDGKSSHSPFHIDDCSEAYALVVEKASPGRIYNLGGPNVTMLAIAESIGRLIGAPTRCIDPEELLQHNLYAVHLAWNLCSDSTRARTELGWNPTARSITDEIERGWYRSLVPPERLAR